jgi:hypothetical protein
MPLAEVITDKGQDYFVQATYIGSKSTLSKRANASTHRGGSGDMALIISVVVRREVDCWSG